DYKSSLVADLDKNFAVRSRPTSRQSRGNTPIPLGQGSQSLGVQAASRSGNSPVPSASSMLDLTASRGNGAQPLNDTLSHSSPDIGPAAPNLSQASTPAPTGSPPPPAAQQNYVPGGGRA
ncbi:MAG: hypothetical protein ACHP6H_06105, partial [Legionellales bacterium]